MLFDADTCDNPQDLHRAIDAAHASARFWRFQFGIGPTKSAIMIFGRRHGRGRAPTFFLGEQALPRVKQYTYLGVSLNERLSWKNHVNHLLGRGERKMAACLFWTVSANLLLSFVERLLQTYVHPSICFGLEFVLAGSTSQSAAWVFCRSSCLRC